MMSHSLVDYNSILEVWRRVRRAAWDSLSDDDFWSAALSDAHDRGVLRKRWFGIGDDDRVF